MKRSFADILAGLEGDRACKLARKLPEWAAAGAEIPSSLALEQCSSSATALYKAGLARQEGAKCILDLTGGLGVDSHAFAQLAERVVYFERDAELAAAARRNFARLGADNIQVHCETVTPDTDLPEADLIYADPARRNAAGRKVFLLEDCTPDILTLLPLLLRKAPLLLLKLSPMADLTMLSERLGPFLQEIHVVESGGEVKELLCLLRKRNGFQSLHPFEEDGTQPAEACVRPCTSSTEPEIIVTRLPGAILRFRPGEEREAEALYAADVQSGELLLEPCPALLKAGAFRLGCKRWGLRKLAPSTHLYTEPSPAAQHPGDGPEAFFKPWHIREVLPLGAALKDLRRRYPRADVTARNLPLGSEDLRKKLGIAPGGDTHIFGCSLADGRAALLICDNAAGDRPLSRKTGR